MEPLAATAFALRYELEATGCIRTCGHECDWCGQTQEELKRDHGLCDCAFTQLFHGTSGGH